MKSKTISLWMLISLLLTGAAAAQPFFTDVTDQAFEGRPFSSRSTAFGDYDNDGWPDLFLSGNGNKRIALWRNQGNGRFTDYTAAIQLDEPLEQNGGGSVFGDYDNDGDLDLYVPFGLWFLPARNLLFRNDRGAFVEVGRAAGLTDVLPTDNALWLDYDRDGFLDIYTGNQRGGAINDPTVRNKLYRNQGNGTFADVTQQAGLDLQLSKLNGGSTGGMAAGDFNDDGWPDLYVGVFLDRNRLFLSNGQGGFRDATTGEIADPGEAFGVAVGDIDNDLDLDIYQVAGGGDLGLQRSLMLLNLGEGQFLDITEGVGLGGWVGRNLSAGLADLDNDGDLDLVLCEPLRLFLNNGEGTFTDQTERLGFSAPEADFAVSWGDGDLDGFLDMAITDANQVQLYHNNGNGNHYLRVELAGTKSNRNGIGARLFATSEDLKQMREVLGGLGFFQDELVAHFGLGQRTKVDTLEIRWPSGQVDLLTDIPADQKIRVIEGSGRYHRVEPTRWQQAPPETLVAGTTPQLNLTVQPALFEPEARITRVTADLSSLGGDAEVVMTAEADGTWVLETALKVKGPNSFRNISAMIDQSTSLGPYWTQLSRRVLVVPAADLPLLAEGLAPGWTAKASNNVAMLDLNQGVQVHTGEKAVALQGTPEGWQLTLQGPALGAVEGLSALGLAIHLGETPQAADAVFKISANSRALPLDVTPRLDLTSREWQEIQVPLTELVVMQPLTKLVLRGTLAGTIYLDDIRLVAATPPPVTVVEEEHTPALPQSFALTQNFPNPFNSDTMIHFALPESGEVELAVYNLAGQQVAKLVEGAREAGTYTVRWDGRDGRGKELASGIYLYRLRAGERMETRKLALVR